MLVREEDLLVLELMSGAPSGSDLKPGSFGISDKGKAEAGSNKAEAQKKKESKKESPSQSFGKSEAGKTSRN